MSRGKIAIVGIGEVPTRIDPERTRWDIIYDVCMEAVRDSGLHKNDIEGVVAVAPQAQPKLAAEISFGKLPEEEQTEASLVAVTQRARSEDRRSSGRSARQNSSTTAPAS